MIYEIFIENNMEVIRANPYECETCLCVFPDCDFETCDVWNMKNEKYNDVIYRGKVGDLLLRLINVNVKKLDYAYDSFLKYIENNKNIDLLNRYDVLKKWLINNIELFDMGSCDEIALRFLGDFIFEYVISDISRGNRDFDSWNKYFQNNKKDIMMLKATLNWFCNDNSNSISLFKFIFALCFANPNRDFDIFLPFTSEENRIMEYYGSAYDSQLRDALAVSEDNIYMPNGYSVIEFVRKEYSRFLELQQSIKSENVLCYDVYNLFDACLISLNYILENGYIIKKCKNCEEYFVPFNRSDALYCDRISPQDHTKTCKEYGAYKQYQTNLKNNEAAGLYRNIYQQKQMRVKRNLDIKEYQIDFEKFKQESKQWKQGIKNGSKTEVEFLEWLKQIKDKKV